MPHVGASVLASVLASLFQNTSEIMSVSRRDFMQFAALFSLGVGGNFAQTLFGTETGAETASDAVRSEVQRQIRSGLIRGASWCCGNSEKIFRPAAEGEAQWKNVSVPVRVESRFDLASVTKTFTAAACALLAAEGKLNPDAPFTEYFPEHRLGTSCDITVRDLAMHVGGYDNSKPYQSRDMNTFMTEICAKMPVRRRLEAFEYSCYNYILLGKIVERVSGKRLDEFCRERIFVPFQMSDTQWGPLACGKNVTEIAWAERIGAVSDETANFCPFPIGNAGIFATVSDLARYAQGFLARRLFPSSFYDLIFTCGYEKNGTRRSFGWDMSSEHRPEGFSDAAIYHSGFTGQTLWLDPKQNFFAVVLTSRTGDWGEAVSGRMRIASLLRTSCRGL